MIIQEEDFKLESISDSSLFFDLELLHTIKPKGGEERQEFKVAGYGLQLETAMKKIVQYRISVKHRDKALSMAEYMKEFKKIYQDISKLCEIK